MEPWLNLFDLTDFIGADQLPASFNKAKLKTSFREVAEGWLSDILDVVAHADYYTLMNTHAGVIQSLMVFPPDEDGLPALPFTKDQYTVGRVMSQFMAYAVWAVYIKKSNVTNTETGLVTKINQDSDPISDRQRAELVAYYNGLAERKALELQRLVRVDNVCEGATLHSGRPTIRKAQRPSPSRLGN